MFRFLLSDGGAQVRRRTLAGLCSMLLTVAAVAQPTVQWENYVGYPASGEEGYKTVRLSATRFVTVGVWGNAAFTLTLPLLVFTDAAGDTIDSHRFTQYPHGAFNAIALADSGGFYAVGTYALADSTGFPSLDYELLMRFDSLGNIRWAREERNLNGRRIERILAVPNGFLSAGNTGVKRFDGAGNLRWARNFGYNSSAQDLAALPDGSYAVLGGSVWRYPAPHNYWSHDNRVLNLTAAGDSLREAYAGDSNAYERPDRIIATTDGGVAFVGRQAILPNTQPRRGMLFKLDANWQEQWRFLAIPPTGDYDRGGHLYTVAELANGNWLVGGEKVHVKGYMAEVVPPAGPGSVGTALWEWQPPGVIIPRPNALFPDPSGAWRVFGNGSNQLPGMGNSDIWLASLTGLPAPATVNLCAMPPSAPAASYQPLPARPDSLLFTLDVGATSAGPTYAEISRVTWDWGDGSRADTGRIVAHVFATPQPVRVRCTITNNLFCTSTTDLFPFGPLNGVQEAAELAASVSVYPNPSASGVFAVRTVGGPEARVTFTVTDAVGRTVAAGALVGAETVLDLRTHAAGVYALRLAWADGRAVTKRLVRW